MCVPEGVFFYNQVHIIFDDMNPSETRTQHVKHARGYVVTANNSAEQNYCAKKEYISRASSVINYSVT